MGTPRSSTLRLSEEGVREAVLELVCEQAARGILLNLLVWLFLLGALADQLSLSVRAAVFGTTLVFSIPRAVMVWSFRRMGDRYPMKTWERLFGTTLVFNGLVWGAAGWLLPPLLDPVHGLLLYLFLVAMALGTALLYGSQQRAAIAVILCMLTPGALWFAIHAGDLGRFAAGAGVLVLGVTIRGVRLNGGLVLSYYSQARELDRARAEAEETARTDFLTGIANRRAFLEEVERTIARSRRAGSRPALIVIDLDRFKRVNDEFGHAAGDQALRLFADALRETARRADLVGRLGGDEFAVLLDDAETRAGERFTARLGSRLGREPFFHTGEPVAFSFGSAILESDETAEEWIARADRALYAAKRGSVSQASRPS